MRRAKGAVWHKVSEHELCPKHLMKKGNVTDCQSTDESKRS